ncbi:MAG: NAD(P)-dependent alcohol dehydrogenase [Clostridiales bacterium]|nr:NAD(P)-dependent alcohol dehydrogenase [Clostridiales bacterium]
MKNRVMRMPEKGRLVEVEEEMPKASEGQVVVRIEYCGICGSDMHFFQNGAIGTRKAPADFILGHECAGTVMETGKAVKTLKVGDRVALEPGIPCGKCEFCRTGKYNLCADVRFMAAAMPPTDGAIREYIAYPEEWCFKLPDNVSTLEGCMIEPLAVGMHAASRGGVALGKTVGIIGVGTIGFMTMLACKAMGAGKIIVSDALPNRLEIAKKFGADMVINAKEEDTEQRILEETNGLGCDVVFEAAGSPYTLAATWKYVKRGGVIVNVGNAGGEVPYLFGELARKEADIRHVWRYRHIYPKAIEAVSKGVINLKDIDPTIFPFEKAQDAFAFAFEQRSRVLKTVIQIFDKEE